MAEVVCGGGLVVRELSSNCSVWTHLSSFPSLTYVHVHVHVQRDCGTEVALKYLPFMGINFIGC